MQKAAQAAFFAPAARVQCSMRRAAVLVLLLPLAAYAEGFPDAFEITQRFANAGAPRAALMRIARLQPASPAGPRWGDWEQLRCLTMYRLERHAELIERVAAMHPNAPAPAVRTCALEGARAAIAIGRGSTARRFLARLIWRPELSADDLRLARLLVIESYLAEGKAHDAYLLMLRFDQDHKPLDRDVAARFAEALVGYRMENEAVNWLSRLDDGSAVKLKLLLHTRLITPEAAVAQARAALAKAGGSAEHWSVLQLAGSQLGNRALQVEALERSLQSADERAAGRVAALANELWDRYVAAAQDLANRQQLLLGDEANWSDFASRQLATSPPTARAFFAALALQGRSRGTREAAQLQLVHALRASALAVVALRLFADAARFPPNQLDPHVRYVLGDIAAEHNQPEAAARYWLGLGTPAGVEPDDWRLRVARVMIRAGAADSAVEPLRAYLADGKPLTVTRLRPVLASVQELRDSGHEKAAEELYRLALPHAPPAERREILFGLGSIAASGSDFQRAADHFLEAALLTDTGGLDAVAINARLHAAANLARAGLKADARAQLVWLQKNVRDADKLELVRREMSKL